MSGQKPLHFLRTTRYWSLVSNFLDDPTSEILELPKSVTAADRDQVRQICKHFDAPFKVHGEGTEKYMVVRKPDFSYLDEHQVSPIEQLCVRLARSLALEKLKYQLCLDKLKEEGKSDLIDEIKNEILIHESDTNFGYLSCANCESANDIVLRMNSNCGHFICSQCDDVRTCKECGHPVGHLIDMLTREIKEEEPVAKKSKH